MASRAEQLRRIKQGEEAKQRALSGVYQQQSTSSPINPRTEALRNYVPPANPISSLPSASNALTGSTLYKATHGDQAAKSEYEAATGVQFSPKPVIPPKVLAPVSQPNPLVNNPALTRLYAGTGDQQAVSDYKDQTGFDFDPRMYKAPETKLSQYEIEQGKINDSNMPSVVKALATAGNRLTRGNYVGNFLSQMTAIPGMAVNPVDSSGSKVVDAVGGFIGRNVAPLLVPTGAPIGSGNMAAPYKAADQLLSTNIGSKAVNAFGNGLGKVPFVSPKLGQDLAKVGLTEGIAGAIQNPAQSLVNDSGRSIKELAVDSGVGAGAGLLLGMGGSALGAGVSALKKNITGKTVTNALENMASPSSNPIIPEAPKLPPQSPKLTPEVPFRQPEINISPRAADVNSPDFTAADIPDFLKSSSRRAQPMDMPNPTPYEGNILNPNQFNEGQGLGISGLSKAKPYESLAADTRSQLVSRIDKEPRNLKGSVDKLYTTLVDDLHPINKFDKLVERVIGKELKASDGSYKVALGSRGSDVIAKQIITDKMVDASGNAIGKSLKDILQDLPKKKDIYVDFEDYLLNKHAITRNARGEKVFRDSLQWTPEKGAKKVQEFEQLFPEFKTMSEDLYNFNKDMVNNWLVDTGMITKEQATAWFDANPFYVPNKRFFSEMEKASGGVVKAKGGLGNQSVPVKKFGKGGSQRKIISPIEATIENVEAYVKAAKRNQVMQNMVENIKRDPDAFSDFAEIIKQPDKQSDISKLLLDGEGIDDILARFSQDFDSAIQKTNLDSDSIVRVLMDGEPVHVRINDKALLDAITSLGPDNANAFMNAVGKLTNTMKVLTTGNNPIFSFTRSLARDIPQAYIASKTTGNPITFAMDLATAAIDVIRGGGSYKEFLNSGGGHSSSIASNRNLLNQSKKAVLPINKLKSAGPKMYNMYENAMNMVESAPRLAEFKRTAAQSGDLKKALYAAQEVTTNFKRRGTLTKDLDKIFPYFNAAIQGLDQVMRIYKDNPVKGLVKSALSLSLPAIALYAINHDDPDYQKLSNRVKDAFFLIPKGDGTFIKIAKPQEQGTIFTDLPERLLRQFNDEDPDAFKDFADRLRTTFLPPGLSGAAKKGGITDRLLGVVGDTIAGPVADVAANKNFSDAPIVPGYLSRLSPELQSDAKTSSVAKWLGEKTKTSPKELDYLARQYTGVIGQFAQPLLSPGGDVGSTLNQQVTADPVFSNDISTEFYKYKDKLDQAYTDRTQKDLPDWYHDGLRKQLGKISDSMSKVRVAIRDVQADTSLSNAEKRDKLRELQEEINQLGSQGNEWAREIMPK